MQLVCALETPTCCRPSTRWATPSPPLRLHCVIGAHIESWHSSVSTYHQHRIRAAAWTRCALGVQLGAGSNALVRRKLKPDVNVANVILGRRFTSIPPTTF